MFTNDLREQAEALLEYCRAAGTTLATAESCTGGLVAALLTAIPGSSDVVERGFVTYSNQSKIDMLDVVPERLGRYGAVSAETAAAMAQGAIRHSGADLAVAITGIAGPGGGSAEKPVGLVWFATARRNGSTLTRRHNLSGDRGAVRAAAVRIALDMLLAAG
ncbi:MAG: CinA family protein [Azospirillaceae bacterium]|nr:CinA family protein [Azospirillaceae bacterium]